MMWASRKHAYINTVREMRTFSGVLRISGGEVTDDTGHWKRMSNICLGHPKNSLNYNVSDTEKFYSLHRGL